MKVDILAFGPHPDDVELFSGGTLHRMNAVGHTTAIVDLTRGELGTRGTVSGRKNESRAATRILGAEVRENLGMPDGNIENSHENRMKIITVLRKYRPTIVLAPPAVARHPDHASASELIRDACYLAGLRKVDTGQERFAPRKILYYYEHMFSSVPDMVVDITESFSEKMSAIRAYKSQFYRPKQRGPQTYLSRKEYLEEVEARARFFGSLIGVKYGEPFNVGTPMPVGDPVALWS
ncbi:MAG: bacillithiol biosynthesis deacetylase BshB1 [Candidatus Hydrogenedentes bacterium]|nr:bacillithiol biosynthesis deacetylase BshB1 [Candidatus Hydrogenedentota bacterium]